MKQFALKRLIDTLKNSIIEPLSKDSRVIDAENVDDQGILDLVTEVCVKCNKLVEDVVKTLEEKSSEIGADSVDEMGALADEFDASGDPMLKHQAAVIDNVIFALASLDEEALIKLREKARADDGEKAYHSVNDVLRKSYKASESEKAIKENIKHYKPLESSLSTRTCPDHPGAQVAKVGNDVYQCSMDGKIYDYKGGFTTMKGSVVPGGDVKNQTQNLWDHPAEHMSFDVRENKLNQ